METNAFNELVIAAQAGKPNSMEKLFEASYQNIYYFILKTAKEKELAEDLTQDTFLRIMEKLGELKTPEAFVTWSRQIAYHCCTDYFRKSKEFLLDECEEGQSPFDLLPEEDAEFIPHEALDREDLKKTLLEMLDALPPEQRSAMVLRYYDELSVSQIAQVQKVSEGTVKSRLNYGRKAMAKSVEAYEQKNNIKLHSIAVVPMLLWLFRKQKLAAGVSISSPAAAGADVQAASPAAGGAAATGIKGFLGTMLGKVTAVLVLGAVTAMTIGLVAGGGSSEKVQKADLRATAEEKMPTYEEGGYAEEPILYYLGVSPEVCRESIKFYEQPAHYDPRLYGWDNVLGYAEKEGVVRLEGDELVAVKDSVYLFPTLDFDYLVNFSGVRMEPAPYSFHTDNGTTYCTFQPVGGETFTCEAETLDDAAVKVLEAYGPTLVSDVDSTQVLDPGTEVQVSIQYKDPDDFQRLAQLLGIGFEAMDFYHTVGEGTVQTIPAQAAPTDNRLDLRNYITIWEPKVTEGFFYESLQLRIRFSDALDDYAAYLADEIPEGHLYRDVTYWDLYMKPENVDGALELINKERKVIQLELQVPEGRDWEFTGNTRGMDIAGTFYKGDVLHFTWNINEEGLRLMEELYDLDLVFEDFTYTLTEFKEHITDDPTGHVYLWMEGTNGNGTAWFMLDYPEFEGEIFKIETPQNGTYSNGDEIQVDLTFLKDRLDYANISFTKNTVTLIVSGLPEE